jgi:long-chain acyl-CoA synthetase
MSLNLAMILRTSARKYPTKTAIIAGDVSIPYAQLDLLARRFAGALKGLGLERGQHVALVMPNVPHFAVAYYGALYAGLVVVPLNVLLTADELAYHLTDSDAAAIICWEGFAPQCIEGAQRAPACRNVIVARASLTDTSAPDGSLSMARLIGGAEPVDELPDTGSDDAAVMLYTSGTTGRSKGAVLTHFNLLYNSESVSFRLLPPDPNRVALGALPLFHSFGQSCILNATIGLGGTVVLLPRFDPTVALELMSKHGVTVFAGVPTMYFALLHYPDIEKFDLSRLQHCLSGGAPLPVEVMRAFDERFKVSILEGYGLSETSPVASFNVLDRPRKPGSVGLPIDGVEFRLVDDEGRVVHETGKPGEICIKGHNIMKGYYKRPDATAEVLDKGWFRTGDVGTRDEDGYYFIVDRKKDMLIRGGFNVYPREIEEILYTHHAILEAAVIGVPHESHGEEVKAIVALKPGATATEAEIIEFCKLHLAAYKYPRIVEFRPSLPKGPTGKILKREMRG